MIIATVTALSILFFGGFDIFFIDELEKGVKKYVEDKDRRKELLASLKESKKKGKDYHKNRKKKFKEFKAFFVQPETSSYEFDSFFTDLVDVQEAYEKVFIEERVKTSAQLTDKEWKKIIFDSQETVRKNQQKSAKKMKKQPVVLFKKSQIAIATISDEEVKIKLDTDLKKIEAGYRELLVTIEELNSVQNEILVDQSSSKEALMTIYDDISAKRGEIFKDLIIFHESISSKLETEEAVKLLNTFYKEMKITPM